MFKFEGVSDNVLQERSRTADKQILCLQKFGQIELLKGKVIFKIFVELKLQFLVFCVCKPHETGQFTDLYGKFISSPLQLHDRSCETLSDTPTLKLEDESCNV